MAEIQYIKTELGSQVEPEFFDYLKSLVGAILGHVATQRSDMANVLYFFCSGDLWQNASQITLEAMEEGSLAFPKVPLMRIEGPLPLIQLLESTLLNLVNFARQGCFFPKAVPFFANTTQ